MLMQLAHVDTHIDANTSEANTKLRDFLMGRINAYSLASVADMTPSHPEWLYKDKMFLATLTLVPSLMPPIRLFVIFCGTPELKVPQFC